MPHAFSQSEHWVLCYVKVFKIHMFVAYACKYAFLY
jgi:hypothetical protein